MTPVFEIRLGRTSSYAFSNLLMNKVHAPRTSVKAFYLFRRLTVCWASTYAERSAWMYFSRKISISHARPACPEPRQRVSCPPWLVEGSCIEGPQVLFFKRPNTRLDKTKQKFFRNKDKRTRRGILPHFVFCPIRLRFLDLHLADGEHSKSQYSLRFDREDSTTRRFSS